jgi:hypothetical protein
MAIPAPLPCPPRRGPCPRPDAPAAKATPADRRVPKSYSPRSAGTAPAGMSASTCKLLTFTSSVVTRRARPT